MDEVGLPRFRADYKDKQLWIMVDDLLNADADTRNAYVKSVLWALVKTKPEPKTKQ